MGFWIALSFVWSEYYTIVEDEASRIRTYTGPSISSWIINMPFLRLWAISTRLRIVLGKCQPLDQYVAYQCQWSQWIQGAQAKHTRGSDSTIYSECQALFLLCHCIYIFTEFCVKPLMGFCVASLFVQSQYWKVMEEVIPPILTHIGPSISSYIVNDAIFKVVGHFTASDSHR